MRHPLPLLTREVRPIELRPEDCLFLLQDLHSAFADAEPGWLASRAKEKFVAREFDEYFETIEVVLDNLELLLTPARSAGFSVGYCCLGYLPPETPSSFQEAIGWDWDLSGPEGRFPGACAPLDNEMVFSKSGWGALSGESFSRFLEENEIRNVILAGSMLDFGIRQTCYELGDRGVGCLVVSDAVAGLTRAGAGATTGNIAHGMTKLRTTAELIDLLDVMHEDGSVLV